nr:hypothetical protein B0A51_14218 [Rachicladosporium sp. CCFEE 5018]
MCRLLHVEWRCTHTQTIFEYCRDCPRTPGPSPQPLRPCDAFLAQHGPNPTTPTADEFRNHCCHFTCCLSDQSELHERVRDLERSLDLQPGGKLKGRLTPGWARGKGERDLVEARKGLARLVKRHGERCEALYYGLGWLQQGAEGWRVEVKLKDGAGGELRAPIVEWSARNVHRYTRSEGEGDGMKTNRISTASAPARS